MSPPGRLQAIFLPSGKKESLLVPSHFLYFVLPRKINDSYFLLWLWKLLISVASMPSSYGPLLPSSVQMSWVCSWVGRAGPPCVLHSCCWCFLPGHTFTFLPQSPIFLDNGRTSAIVQGIPVEQGWCKWEIWSNSLSYINTFYFWHWKVKNVYWYIKECLCSQI